jgi:hypothetical protein
MSAAAGADRPVVRKWVTYHNVTIMRLALIYFGRLTYEIFLGLFGFYDDGFHCGFQTIAVDGERHRSKVDDSDPASGSTIRVAKRDAIVERHEKSIGVSVERRRCAWLRCGWDDEVQIALIVSRVSAAGRKFKRENEK